MRNFWLRKKQLDRVSIFKDDFAKTFSFYCEGNLIGVISFEDTVKHGEEKVHDYILFLLAIYDEHTKQE